MRSCTVVDKDKWIAFLDECFEYAGDGSYGVDFAPLFTESALKKSKIIEENSSIVSSGTLFTHKAVTAEMKKYPKLEDVVWCQDEPQNQGPWFQIQHNIFESLDEGQKLAYAGRPASASPAVGYYDKHYAQQKALLDAAFSKIKGFVLTK